MFSIPVGRLTSWPRELLANSHLIKFKPQLETASLDYQNGHENLCGESMLVTYQKSMIRQKDDYKTVISRVIRKCASWKFLYPNLLT